MKFLPSLLIASAIAATPVVWHYSQSYFAPAAVSDRALEHSDVSSPQMEFTTLRDQVARLEARVDALDARSALGLSQDPRDAALNAGVEPKRDSLQDSFAQVVLIAARRSANEGLQHASSTFLKELIGLPRPDLSDECQGATNTKLRELLATESVGPIRARLVRPALISLRQVFKNVQVFEPELYKRIQSAGSLCVRRVRGSTSSASAHAYGLAVDINIDGVLDRLADGKTQLGLILLADFFKKEGWIWGAGFTREDSMHFEISRGKLEQWRRLGQI
ncbi:MAG: M15 family metallopeptidase [Paracoccaceae bacterium]